MDQPLSFPLLLVSAPMKGRAAPFLRESVLLLFRQVENRVYGIALNKPYDIPFDRFSAKTFPDGFPPKWRVFPVNEGGDRGTHLILAVHSPEVFTEHSQFLPPDLMLTPCLKETHAFLFRPKGPKQMFLAAGARVWDDRELTEQIDCGYWGVLPSDSALVFAPDRKELWPRCKAKLEALSEPGRPFLPKEQLAVNEYFLPGIN